jgi:hypothetical protein
MKNVKKNLTNQFYCTFYLHKWIYVKFFGLLINILNEFLHYVLKDCQKDVHVTFSIFDDLY